MCQAVRRYGCQKVDPDWHSVPAWKFVLSAGPADFAVDLLQNSAGPADFAVDFPQNSVGPVDPRHYPASWNYPYLFLLLRHCYYQAAPEHFSNILRLRSSGSVPVFQEPFVTVPRPEQIFQPDLSAEAILPVAEAVPLVREHFLFVPLPGQRNSTRLAGSADSAVDFLQNFADSADSAVDLLQNFAGSAGFAVDFLQNFAGSADFAVDP